MQESKCRSTLKRCPRCAGKKPVEAFGRRKDGGFRGYCRPCELERVQLNIRKRRAVVPVPPAHACSNPVCCGLARPVRPEINPRDWLLWGLGRRNEELLSEGLPRIGVLILEGGRAEVWLDRKGPPRTFRTRGNATSWAAHTGVKVIRG